MSAGSVSHTRYQLSALGIINALGNNKDEVRRNFLAGTSLGMKASGMRLTQQACWTGQVTAELPRVPDDLAEFSCRNNQLLLAALNEIAVDTAKAITRYGSERVAVVIGSSTSGIFEGEQGLRARLQNGAWPQTYHYRQQEIGSPALFVARYLQLHGIALTVSTACSSSAKAMATARNLLNMGLCDAVICGGADSLCQLTLKGFAALESIAPERCEPFAQGRNGITIGEGAALFLIEKESACEGEKACTTQVYLAGVGESADAHHISAPHPEGLGAQRAMQAALIDAGVQAADIDYLNLHGTATPLNDAMESQALAAVFADRFQQGPLCSSTKPLTGHTLGAAGATEVGLCWLLLTAGEAAPVLPAQINSAAPDSALPAIALLRKNTTLPAQNRYRFLSNSFAFGGSNAAVLIEAGSQPSTIIKPSIINPNPEHWLPHRKPMLLLDAVLDCTEEISCTEVRIDNKASFFDPTLNGVPAWVGLEYMAQTVGVWAGYQCHLVQQAIKPSFLISCRSYTHTNPAAVFTEGMRLRITAKMIYSDENGVGAFECHILDSSDTVLAHAQVNTFRPQHPEEHVRKPT